MTDNSGPWPSKQTRVDPAHLDQPGSERISNEDQVVVGGSLSETSNPYESSKVDHSVESPQPKMTGLPQPGLLLAVVLTLLPIVAQILVGFALALIVAFVYVVVTRRPQELHAFFDDSEVFFFPIGTLTTLFVALAVAYLICGRNMARCLAWRGFSNWQGLAMLLLVIPVGIVASELTNIVAEIMALIEPEWLRAFRKSGASTFEEFAKQPFLLVFVAGCLLPGAGEEILCRGVMSRGLIARLGLWQGTFWTALLFGVMHLEPVQAFGAFAIGIGLQFVFLTTRSLAAPMMVHALNNAFAFTLMKYHDVLPLPGLSTSPEEGAHIPAWLFAAALIALVASLILLFQIRTTWRLPDGTEWSPGYFSAERPPPGVHAAPISAAPKLSLLIANLGTFSVLMVAMLIASQLAGA